MKKKYIKPSIDVLKTNTNPIMCGSRGGHHGGGHHRPPHHHHDWDKDFPWDKHNNEIEYEENY